MAHGFFAYVNSTWNSATYEEARYSYRKLTPFYTNAYFSPQRSIMQITNLAASLIHSPLWLALNTLFQAIKAVVNLIAAVLLFPITLAALIVAPQSNFCTELKSSFRFTVANTLVASAMAALAALATIASLFLKPVQITTNVLSTIYDTSVDTLNSCRRC